MRQRQQHWQTVRLNGGVQRRGVHAADLPDEADVLIQHLLLNRGRIVSQRCQSCGGRSDKIGTDPENLNVPNLPKVLH